MIDEQKKQIRKGVDELADNIYKAMVQSYEMVEKDLPSDIPDDQKQQIFTSIFNMCFETQTQLLNKTMAETKQKVKDQDYVLKVAKEIHNARK